VEILNKDFIMKTYHSIFILLIPALIFSCKKEATIKLPKQENKLVVTCFISPGDTLISARVKASVPEYGQQQNFDDDVMNATVMLMDDAHAILLPFDPTQDAYVISSNAFIVVSGKTYSLIVSTPDGKQVSASTTVPSEQFELQSITTHTKNEQISASSTFTFESFDYDLTIGVNDIPNKTSYLEVFFQNFTYNSSDTTSMQYVQPDSLYNQASDAFFATDESGSRSVYSYNYSSSFYGTDIQSAQVNIAILNCSPEFYKYNESLQRSENADGNPFSEPVFVYTNIAGGFGCFGSFVGNYVTKKIR